MEGFLSDAAQDEARVARMFASCDADGDGVLSRAEYTNFLRLAQPDYLQQQDGDGSPGLTDEAWHEECANLGASEPTASAALGFNAEAFGRLYTYFGRSVMLDYENVVPPDVRAAADGHGQVGTDAATAATAATTQASENSGSGATKLQRLGKTLDDIETAAAAATAGAGDASVLQTGRKLRAAMAALLEAQPEVERAYKRAGGGGGEAIYGERAAAEALSLHARLLALLEAIGEQIEQDSVEFAAAEAAEAEAAANAAAAAAAAEEAERQRAERAACDGESKLVVPLCERQRDNDARHGRGVGALRAHATLCPYSHQRACPKMAS